MPVQNARPRETLPFVQQSFVLVTLLQSRQLLNLDRLQRDRNPRLKSTGWVTGLAIWINTVVFPNMPAPFGTPYRNFVENPLQVARPPQVTADIIYDLAHELGPYADIVGHDSPADVVFTPPIVAPVDSCPSCRGVLIRDDHQIRTAWRIGPANAQRSCVFIGKCTTCSLTILPDRYTLPGNAAPNTNVFFNKASVLYVMRGRYVTRSLGESLGIHSAIGHVPLSNYAKLWNAMCAPPARIGQPKLVISHELLWRAFVLHYALRFSGDTAFSYDDDPELNDNPDEEPEVEDVDGDETIEGSAPIVRAALRIFPSVQTGPYPTYKIPGTEGHSCKNCAHFHRTFRPEDARDFQDRQQRVNIPMDRVLDAHRNVVEDRSRVSSACIIDGMENLGHKICAVQDCGKPVNNFRDGTFCSTHLPFEKKCGIVGCIQDAMEPKPVCAAHEHIYDQYERRKGRQRSRWATRRLLQREAAIQAGAERQDWEPAPEPWDPAIEHRWSAKYIKTVEIAVTACGIPVGFTKFPFAEGPTDIARFMAELWPPGQRPHIISIDKGCQVMRSLDAAHELRPPTGWLSSSLIVVDLFHFNGHQDDELCVRWSNPTDRFNPNLVQIAPNVQPQRARAEGHGLRARARREAAAAEGNNRLQRSFNFEWAEETNAWIDDFRPITTRMRAEHHDLFLCIVFTLRAESILKECELLE